MGLFNRIRRKVRKSVKKANRFSRSLKKVTRSRFLRKFASNAFSISASFVPGGSKALALVQKGSRIYSKFRSNSKSFRSLTRSLSGSKRSPRSRKRTSFRSVGTRRPRANILRSFRKRIVNRKPISRKKKRVNLFNKVRPFKLFPKLNVRSNFSKTVTPTKKNVNVNNVESRRRTVVKKDRTVSSPRLNASARSAARASTRADSVHKGSQTANKSSGKSAKNLGFIGTIIRLIFGK